VLLVLALVGLVLWIANMPDPQDKTGSVPADPDRAHKADQ